jgi:hypothetical protein
MRFLASAQLRGGELAPTRSKPSYADETFTFGFANLT